MPSHPLVTVGCSLRFHGWNSQTRMRSKCSPVKNCCPKRARLILWTPQISKRDIPAALRIGVSALLLDPISLNEMHHALAAVSTGGIFFSAAAQTLYPLPRDHVDRPCRLPFGLTHREYQVLQLIEQGMAQKQVASHLSISPNTVNNHMASVRHKLGVQSARTWEVHYRKKSALKKPL